MIIAVDFDGTCTTHDYPEIGTEIGAVPVLRKLVEKGHKLILFTMRSKKLDKQGKDRLQEAVDWFEKNDIELYGIQKNPSQRFWTSSPKCYAQMYIDDAALGCPLIHGIHERPYVDWQKVDELTKNLSV